MGPLGRVVFSSRLDTLGIRRRASLVLKGPCSTIALSQVGPGGRNEETVMSTRRRGFSCALPQPRRAVNVCGAVAFIGALPAYTSYEPSCVTLYLPWQCTEHHVALGTLPVVKISPLRGRCGSPPRSWGRGVVSRWDGSHCTRHPVGCSARALPLGEGREGAILVTRWDPARAPSPPPTRARLGLTLVTRVICAGPTMGRGGAPRGPGCSLGLGNGVTSCNEVGPRRWKASNLLPCSSGHSWFTRKAAYAEYVVQVNEQFRDAGDSSALCEISPR